MLNHLLAEGVEHHCPQMPKRVVDGMGELTPVARVGAALDLLDSYRVIN